MKTIDMMLDREGWWIESPFADRQMIVVKAHPTNYYCGASPDFPARICKPICLVWHEPQEPVDNRESTPYYFQNPNISASTKYYNDHDGDVFQCVPDFRPAIANGLKGRIPPKFNDGGPEFGAYSINDQSENTEVEGYTHNISQTMTQQQWQGCVDLGVILMLKWNWPRNVKRVSVAHGHLASDRTDGLWIAASSGIPQEIVKVVTKIDVEIGRLSKENEARKGEIQQMFGTLYGKPFGDPKGVIPRIEKLEKE